MHVNNNAFDGNRSDVVLVLSALEWNDDGLYRIMHRVKLIQQRQSSGVT